MLLLAILFYASPNVKEHGFRLVTPGSLVALAAWAVASALFGFFAANFGSYDKTYGSLAGVIVLLIWLWISNLAILFGHQLNAERQALRARHRLGVRTKEVDSDWRVGEGNVPLAKGKSRRGALGGRRSSAPRSCAVWPARR